MQTGAAKRSSSASCSRVPKNRIRGLRPSRRSRVRATGLPSYGPRWGTCSVYDGSASGQSYPGQYFDQETGLHYNLLRDYDPKTGRYIEADPIGLAGGMNLYPYAGNSPVNVIDPLGLQALPLPLPVPVPGPPIVIPSPPDLTPGQWDDMRDFLGRFNPIPLINYLKDTIGGSPAAPIPLNPSKECKDDKSDDRCDKKLDRGLLRGAGLLGREHSAKEEALGSGKGLSRFDLCGCKDGRVVVKLHGCKGPIIAETPYTWK